MINEMSVVERARFLVGGDFPEEVRRQVKKTNSLLFRLQKAEEAGARSKVRTQQLTILRSHAAKLCAIVLNVEAVERGYTADDLHRIADDLAPFSDPEESVKAWAKVKSRFGDWRPICEFGLHRRACQSLVGALLDARFEIHPLDYMAAGRGANAAADRINEFVDDGFEWFVLADIENNFGSVQPLKAAEILGLPRAVVTHCLMIREEVSLTLPLHLPIDTNPTAFSEAVRQGLPQGARSANRVMARLLGPKIEALPSFEQGMFYGDDVLLAASSRKKAEAAAEALQEMLATHPAGPFRLKRLEVKAISEGFDYAKYRCRRDLFDTHMKITPASKSYRKFRDKVREIVRDEHISEVYEAVMAYRSRWLAAFPRYQRTADQEVQALNLLWQSVIDSLRPALRRKWDRACEVFVESGVAVPGTPDDWLDVEKVLGLAGP